MRIDRAEVTPNGRSADKLPMLIILDCADCDILIVTAMRSRLETKDLKSIALCGHCNFVTCTDRDTHYTAFGGLNAYDYVDVICPDCTAPLD